MNQSRIVPFRGRRINSSETGVTVTTTRVLPLLSSESEVNTTVRLPIGTRTLESHVFWLITGCSWSSFGSADWAGEATLDRLASRSL